MSHSVRPIGLALTAILAYACGGGQTSEDEAPLCYASHPPPDSGLIRPLRNREWAELIIRNYREGQSASQDCVGDSIQWHATPRECEVHEPDDEAPPEALELSDDSVVVGRTDRTTRKVVWVITHRFEDGDGFGPVVLADRTADGVVIRAMGTLRLPTERARLRLRETGGQEVLVADGERCPPEEGEEEEEGGAGGGAAPTAGAAPGAAPAAGGGGEAEEEAEPTCLRSTRLLPRVGDRFLSPEVRDQEGHCIGPALIHTSRERVIGLENGWQRRFKLVASLEYQGSAIVVHEQVMAEDFDPRDPGRPPLPFRTSDSDRVIFLTARGGMRSVGTPLFERATRAQGSIQLPLDEAEGGRRRAAPQRPRE